ncbi:hypothetical protein BHE90_005124 [Fusarium euwallaceae]|uniref:Uncharacterized protein n=2 Tax=Fusarium solani species complex TaxID=232080 RepID=A0A430LXC7_9HYPO|nr:hypothetical protein CEP51_009865 [Fusarium floridanum]RTE80380.1 hypothetical protein BHE90_005124 [Fusarium euwallaceae]
MAPGNNVSMDTVMAELNKIAHEGRLPLDLDVRCSLDDKVFHAINLGKNRLMADPAFAYGIPRHPVLDKILRKEMADIKDNGGKGDKPGSRAWCALYGHGRDAMWPPMDPGRPHREMKEALERQVLKMETAWKKFRHLVLGKERLIQDTVIKLARANGKLTESHTIEEFLKNAWREARDCYNQNFVEKPDHLGRDYLLDPDGTIADGHSSDLEIFALDFLKDVTQILMTQVHRHHPVYRHGANYQDESKTLADIMVMKTKRMDQLKMPEPINAKFSFNKNVADHLRKIRANFLVPHINLRDLLDPYNLLSFIHHRARLVPSEFSLLDNDLSYLGRHSMILSGYFDCAVDVSFRVPSTNNNETESDRLLGIWFDNQHSEPEDKPKQQALLDAGDIFVTMEAFLILQSQTVTYLFLGKLCEALLQAAQGEALGHSDLVADQDEEAEALRTIQGLRGNSRERWQDIPSIRQYEPIPATVNLDRYQENIISKKERAEDHIRRLFNEPEYFFQHLLEQKEHHWVNVDISYEKLRDQYIEKYHKKEDKRYILYEDCLRSVLRRAVFEFFMWNAVEQALVKATEFEASEPPYGQDKMVPSTHKDGAKTWPSLKWSTHKKGEIWIPGTLRGLHFKMQYMIRWFGAFFVLEFRNKAIHAASQPMRDIFCIKKAPQTRGLGEGAKFWRGHYISKEIELGLTKKTLAEDRENLTRIVAELIENFISNKTSSMYMGMRKVTARLQRYLDDCGNEDTARVFSTLVSDTIDSIDLLAELAEHLELHCEVHGLQMTDPEYDEEEKRQKAFSESLEGISIDFIAFDDFVVEDVPGKRLKRLYQFLDQMQGFSNNTINIGEARGDLKRLGSSLLHTLIYKQNRESQFQATDEALDSLARMMGVTRDQYPFDQRERPMDMDKLEKLPGRWPTNEWKSIRQELLDDEKRRKKEGKKPWNKKGEGSKVKDDPVANLQKRMEIYKARQQKEIEVWRRNKRRQKEKWRRRFWGVAKPGDTGAASEDDSESESDPAGDGGKVGNIAGGIQKLGIQNQPGPQPPAQRPLPPLRQPLPAHRQPGGQPGRQPGIQQLQLPPQPPARQLPLPSRATDVSPPTPGLAPDGQPLGKLKKRVWETFRRLLGKSNALVSWEELSRALGAIGYEEEGRGGSHAVFTRTRWVRWGEESLPKAKHIQLSKFHGGSRKGAPRRKTLDWGMRLGERGFTWGFFRQWYREVSADDYD